MIIEYFLTLGGFVVIKSYIYVKGEVVAKGEKEIEKVVPYYDNVGARFVVQNEIEFLTSKLKKDEQNYEDKVIKRSSSWNAYKVLVPFTGAISVALPVAFNAVAYGLASESVYTRLGNMSITNGVNCFFVPFFLIGGQILASTLLFLRPSKKEIAGSFEMIKYEKETLELKQKELEKLEQDESKENESNYNSSVVVKVDDSKQIKRHKENLILRYEYGARKDKIYNMYKEGTLWETMKEQGFLEESMTDYMIFVEQEFSKKVDNLVVLSKKNS